MLGFPNRIDESTLSGGSWAAGLPLVNLRDRDLDAVARSASLALASTQFQIDLGTERTVQAIALRKHSISLSGKYRIRAGTTASVAASTVYDSGWTDAWPAVYPFGAPEWEDDTFWTGKYSSEEIQGYTSELDHLLAAACLARYWLVEIDDAANALGYVDIGRVFIGPVWQPTVNMSAGATLGWESRTEVQEALSGAETFQERVPFRSARFSISMLGQDEAFSRAFELQRRAGISREVLFIHSPNDTTHALRRRFIGRLRTLSALEYPSVDRNSVGFEIKETL
jgi:hypothetical protein